MNRFWYENTDIVLNDENECETVYERVIDVATPAHEMRSGDYYVELHFLKVLNRKVLWREFWEWKLCNVKIR